MDTASKPTTSRESSRQIVCACAEMSLGELEAAASGTGGSFEKFLTTKGPNGIAVGQRCTACLLDLEYLFTTFQNNDVSRTAPAVSDKPTRKVPFKQKIYRILDGIAPLVPVRLWNSAIVLSGKGLKERVVVANDGLMFDQTTCAPPITVSIVVRDQQGKIQHRDRYPVEVGQCLDLEVSKFLDPGAEPIVIGSVEVGRTFRRSGYRGTTRPQVMVEASKGSSAVHTQAAYTGGERWVTLGHQPGVERFFLGLASHSDHSLSFTVIVYGEAGEKPEESIVEIPPRGACLHEVTPSKLFSASDTVTVCCRARSSGDYKITFVMANGDLSQISIDHPS